MTTARALAFGIYAYTLTALMAVIGLPILVAPPSVSQRYSQIWAIAILGGLRLLCGLGHEIRGRENLPTTPAIIAAKHQSAWETAAMPSLFPNIAMVLKKELLWIPLVGWYLRRAGEIPVDRKAGMSALKRMITAARQAKKDGRPILIFPEGTRTAPGKTGAFHPGITALYKNLAVPVVPVALNSGLYWGRRRFRKRPGTIIIEFLPAIPPGLPPRDFTEHLRATIESATQALESEAGISPPSPGKTLGKVGKEGKSALS